MRMIDADAAADHLKACLDKARRDDIKAIPIILGMIQYIDNLPTIEAEPVRHGDWIFHEQKYGYLWKCSKCKGNFDQQYSYCPHCGAMMNGGADNATN